MSEAQPEKSAVQFLEVSEHQEDQRLDNFLVTRLKGVPKTLIYRIIRKGVNSALASLPTRTAIIKSLNLHELSPDECHAQLKKAQTSMRSVIDEVTALLKEHQLQDIK